MPNFGKVTMVLVKEKPHPFQMLNRCSVRDKNPNPVSNCIRAYMGLTSSS